MVYEFAKYPDETLVVFSDIRKKENGEDVSMILQNMEDNVSMQLDSVINSGLSESTSPIERQDVY